MKRDAEKPCHVLVITRDLSAPSGQASTRSVVIDHNEFEHRKWLGKHCYWAMRNNHSVMTEPTEAAVTLVLRSAAQKGHHMTSTNDIHGGTPANPDPEPRGCGDV